MYVWVCLCIYICINESTWHLHIYVCISRINYIYIYTVYIYIYSIYIYSINQTSMTCIYIHLWRWKPPMSFMGNLSAVYGERVGVAIYIYIVKRENCCPGFVYIYIYIITIHPHNPQWVALTYVCKVDEVQCEPHQFFFAQSA